MERTEYDEIVGLQYIREGTYPDGATKNYKRRLREKAKSFAVEEDKCKKLWFIHELTAHDTSKTAKITKR